MTCQRKPHYGEKCECEERLAAVTAHTRKSVAFGGPDFCEECSAAISEWVPWPCEGVQKAAQDALETIAYALCYTYWHSCPTPCANSLKDAKELVEAVSCA